MKWCARKKSYTLYHLPFNFIHETVTHFSGPFKLHEELTRLISYGQDEHPLAKTKHQRSKLSCQRIHDLPFELSSCSNTGNDFHQVHGRGEPRGLTSPTYDEHGLPVEHLNKRRPAQTAKSQNPCPQSS